jgi:hypothetical protein
MKIKIDKIVRVTNAGLIKHVYSPNGENTVDVESTFLQCQIQKSRFDYSLPGRGKVGRDSCGTIRKVFRCKDTGNPVIRHHYCYRKDCPICYGAWAKRQANAIEQRVRIHAHSKNTFKYAHWVIAPPVFASLEDIEKIRKQIYQSQYFSGGFLIFHPYRLKVKVFDGIETNYIGWQEAKKAGIYETSEKVWVWGPHWHLITHTTYMSQGVLAKFYNTCGSVIKHVADIDIRTNRLNALLTYELAHVGIRDKEQSVRYFGELSNSKLNYLSYKVKVTPICACSVCREKQNLNERSLMDEYEAFVKGETSECVVVNDKKKGYRMMAQVIIKKKDGTSGQRCH